MSENYKQDDDGLLVIDREKQDERQQVKPPRKYAVVMLNDDFTPMDFVVEILMKFFGKNMEDASRIMLDVHKKGKGIAGTYSMDIAETKAVIANDFAQEHEHPFRCLVEPVE